MIEYTASTALPWLAAKLIDERVIESRDGDTHEVLMQNLTLLEPYKREILTPERKASLVSQIAETMWVLSGQNSVAWLERYLPRAPQFSDDGKVWRGGYGPRLRNWRGTTDQLESVISLLKENPDTRRAVIQIFDPELDYTDSKDIPCNNWLSFLLRDGKLNLHVGVRSNDLIWGWSGINAFEWSTLQELVAGVLGVEVGRLHFSTTSLHAYSRHDGKLRALSRQVGFKDYRARVEEEIFTPPERTFSGLDWLISRWMEIEELIRTGDPDASQSLQDYPEPMLRSWLGVIWAYWNNGDTQFIPKGGRLILAYESSPKSLQQYRAPEAPTFAEGSFNAFVDSLHREKSVAYGGSWSRRGEVIGIMANLARKADRLGVAGGGDTSADTAIDFLVYLVLYRLWLVDHMRAPSPVPGLATPAAGLANVGNNVARMLASLEEKSKAAVASEDAVRDAYDHIEANALSEAEARWTAVDELLPTAYALAAKLAYRERLTTLRWGGYGDE